MSTRKLTRSTDNCVIAGVCGGLAEYFEVDANIVRLVTVVASLISAGVVTAAYLVCWLTIPEQGSGETGADHLYDRYGDYKQRRASRDGAPQPEGPTDTFQAD